MHCTNRKIKNKHKIKTKKNNYPTFCLVNKIKFWYFEKKGRLVVGGTQRRKPRQKPLLPPTDISIWAFQRNGKGHRSSMKVVVGTKYVWWNGKLNLKKYKFLLESPAFSLPS